MPEALISVPLAVARSSAVSTRCRRRAESAWRPLRIVSVRAPATVSPAGLRLVMRPGLSFRR